MPESCTSNANLLQRGANRLTNDTCISLCKNYTRESGEKTFTQLEQMKTLVCLVKGKNVDRKASNH